MISNKELYETVAVVEKYSAKTTRTRQLNNAEKYFVDKFEVTDKNILVLGSGGGRVPANLLLFGNKVNGVERSAKLNQQANKIYPHKDFRRLTLVEGDATQLNDFNDGFYDVVFFPQNGIDYISDVSQRDKAILEMAKKVKNGGLLVFSSHNSLAYGTSFIKHKGFKSRKLLFSKYVFEEENVVGGGVIFKGKPRYVIDQTIALTGFDFVGFTCDSRNRISHMFMRSLFSASLIFDYILYVFKK